MQPKRWMVLGWALALGLLLGWAVAPVWAGPRAARLARGGQDLPRLSPQEKQVIWERIEVDLTVDRSGVLYVEERITVTFQGGPFRYGYRRIPLRYLTRLEVESVADEQGPYVKGQQAPRGFVVDGGEDELRIRWFFDPVSDTRRTFILRYRVYGALRFYPEGEQLWWRAVFPDRDGPVQEAVAVVRVPGQVRAARAYFVPAQVEQVDPFTVRFVASKAIPPGTPWEVRVEWPAGVVNGTPAPWQAEADREVAQIERRMIWEQRWRPLAEVFTAAASVLLFLVGGVALLLHWYQRGRDPQTEIYAEYLTEPPSDLPPALVGALVDERVDAKEILATLFDLARRGVLDIIEEGMDSFRFRLREIPPYLQPFEKEILRTLFGRSPEQRLEDWRHVLARSETYNRMARAIFAAAVKAGLFPHNPMAVRQRYLLLGLPLAILGGLALFGGFTLSEWLATAWLPGAALLALGVAVPVVGVFMPRKTRKGAVEAAKWRAFRRYLSRLQDVDVAAAQDLLERYLPYAIALGVEKDFLQRLAALEEEAQRRRVTTTAWWPSWYHTSHYGETATTSSSGRSGEGPSPGARLSQASRSVGASLSRLSASLGHLLSVSAQTMSQPVKSSGSGFGGFSGGGSVGGGGGGGGGGGFG